jgi:hypothetical protein
VRRLVRAGPIGARSNARLGIGRHQPNGKRHGQPQHDNRQTAASCGWRIAYRWRAWERRRRWRGDRSRRTSGVFGSVRRAVQIRRRLLVSPLLMARVAKEPARTFFPRCNRPSRMGELPGAARASVVQTGRSRASSLTASLSWAGRLLSELNDTQQDEGDSCGNTGDKPWVEEHGMPND